MVNTESPGLEAPMQHLTRLISRSRNSARLDTDAGADGAWTDALGAAALFVLLFAALHLPLFN